MNHDLHTRLNRYIDRLEAADHLDEDEITALGPLFRDIPAFHPTYRRAILLNRRLTGQLHLDRLHTELEETGA